jgi:hypothetical protein
MSAYRVYWAPEGAGLSFVGDYPTMDDAHAAASADERGLHESMWGTARAAGHVGGLIAPPQATEDEHGGWAGPDGHHYIVGITERKQCRH